MKRIFITGTDTDCGKTYVTCQLLDYLHQRDLNAVGIKPIASGCLNHNDVLINEDILNLQKHNRNWSSPINGWLFRSPCSPHLAAFEEGIKLNLKEVAAFCDNENYSKLDFLLIEGAGGLIVPLNEEETWLDFLQITKIPVIVVVGMRVGCINHALMTASVLQQQGHNCLGWIANCLNPEMIYLEENIATLKSKLPMPLIGRVNYDGNFQSYGIL